MTPSGWAALPPEALSRAARETCTLVLLGVPAGVRLGCDVQTWQVGERFTGIKLIPSGVHLFHYTSGQEDFRGFFFNAKPGGMIVKRWDKSAEDFEADGKIDAPTLGRLQTELWRGDLDKNLAAYPLESFNRWTSLTSDVTTAVLDSALIPAGVPLVGDVAGESALGKLDLPVLLQRMGLRQQNQLVPRFGDAPRSARFTVVVNPVELSRALRESKTETAISSARKIPEEEEEDELRVEKSDGLTSSQPILVNTGEVDEAVNTNCGSTALSPSTASSDSNFTNLNTTNNNSHATIATPATDSAPTNTNTNTNTNTTTSEQHQELVAKVWALTMGNKLEGPSITALMHDRTPMLNHLLNTEFENSESRILGEFQLSFVLFVYLSSLGAFEHWKRMTDLLCHCPLAMQERPSMYVKIVHTVMAQFEFLPDDFFHEATLTGESFLVPAVSALLNHYDVVVESHMSSNNGKTSELEKTEMEEEMDVIEIERDCEDVAFSDKSEYVDQSNGSFGGLSNLNTIDEEFVPSEAVGGDVNGSSAEITSELHVALSKLLVYVNEHHALAFIGLTESDDDKEEENILMRRKMEGRQNHVPREPVTSNSDFSVRGPIHAPVFLHASERGSGGPTEKSSTGETERMSWMLGPLPTEAESK